MLTLVVLTCAFIQFEIAVSYNISFCTSLICPDLSKFNIKCTHFENHIDCLRSINKNETQLGYALPFESIVATQVLPNLELVGEVRPNANSRQWMFEIVALTNRPVSNFEELKDFSYCTPNFGDLPKFVVNGLEEAILKNYKSPNCRKKSSFVEEQVCGLNEFFGPSCRAGTFNYNSNGRDTRKTNYTKLFQLCPKDECTTQTGCTFHNHEDCLQLKQGAVAITTFKAATLHPNLFYLCQNGSTSIKPCVWYSQPWPLIFTHKSLKQSIAAKLNGFLSICAVQGGTECLHTFGEILTGIKDPYISVLNENKIPNLKPYKLNSSGPKNKAIRWCAISHDEYEKCSWLKALSGTLIHPVECILKDSKALCLSAIENHEADLVEIVRLPITNALSPITISTTPITIFNDKYSLSKEASCTEKFYYVNSTYIRGVSATKYSSTLCPNGWYQQICTNETNQECHYHSEVIMRMKDRNRENAKVLLADLAIFLSEETTYRNRPFNFFGNFNGIPNLLLQSNNTGFFNIKYDKITYKVEEDNSLTDDSDDEVISYGAKLAIILAVFSLAFFYGLIRYLLLNNNPLGRYNTTRTEVL